LKLLDAGQGDKAPIRLKPEVGRKHRVVIDTRLKLQMKLGEFGLPEQNVPPQILHVDLEVTRIDEQGDIHFTMEFTRIDILSGEGIPEVQVELMREIFSQLQGMKGKGIMNSQGITKSMKLEIPESAQSRVRQQMESITDALDHFTSPFPEEAVGQGARWVVSRTLNRNGARVEQNNVYELLEFDGQGGKVKIAIEQKASNQVIQPPNAPPTAKVNLRSLAGNGEAETTFNLSRISPRAATIKMATAMRTSNVVQGKTQDIDLNINLNLTISEGQPDSSSADGSSEEKTKD
jgi:hypothetical protein